MKYDKCRQLAQDAFEANKSLGEIDIWTGMPHPGEGWRFTRTPGELKGVELYEGEEEDEWRRW